MKPEQLCGTSLCRTRSVSGLTSDPRDDVLDTEERRLLQSDAKGERLGDWSNETENKNKRLYYGLLFPLKNSLY